MSTVSCIRCQLHMWRQGLGTNKSVEAIVRTCKREARSPRVKKQQKTHLDPKNFGFICAGVSNVGSYKRNA